jgi:lipoprotein-anchoring transpeptidase ErfK/SrfK
MSSLELEGQLSILRTRLQALQPTGRYLIIDTVSNRLYLKQGDTLLLEAVCSTGSGERLITDQGEWTFKTPRGKFRIRSKVRDPVWRKPDWAFLEKGLSIPVNDGERFVKGALGDWALGLGDGYFIHGTPYTRLLGQSVSHGCIRLHNRDLGIVAEHVMIGDLVYIF